MVLRDVPLYPTIVVIPSNDYLEDIRFANSLESMIIGAGIRVITRLIAKEVTVTNGVGQAIKDTQIDNMSAMETTKRERYYVLDETKANYAAFTFAEMKQVKLVKIDTKEILIIFNFSDLTSDPYGALAISRNEKVKLILKNLGFPIKSNN